MYDWTTASSNEFMCLINWILSTWLLGINRWQHINWNSMAGLWEKNMDVGHLDVNSLMGLLAQPQCASDSSPKQKYCPEPTKTYLWRLIPKQQQMFSMDFEEVDWVCLRKYDHLRCMPQKPPYMQCSPFPPNYRWPICMPFFNISTQLIGAISSMFSNSSLNCL